MKRIIILASLILAALLVPGLAFASSIVIGGPVFHPAAGGGSPVVFDAVSQSTGSGVSSLSWSHTCSGSDRGLFVGVSWILGTATVSSVTYNGVSMTQLWSVSSGGVAVKSAGYFLAAPVTGSNTIAVTFSASIADGVQGVGVSFTGVDQATPTGTPVSSTGTAVTSGSVTVGSVGANDLLVDMFGCWSNSITVGADQTVRREIDNLFSNSQSHGCSTQPGSAGGVMSWSFGSSTSWAGGAVAVKPANP